MNAVPPFPQRSLSHAALDALPDALAALACAIAWAAPRALGFDLLGVAAPLYFIELPLALIAMVAGVRRVSAGRLSTRERVGFVALPTLALALVAYPMLGAEALIAIAWLGARSITGLLRDPVDRSAAVSGLWLVFGRRGARTRFELTTTRPPPAPGTIVVPAGHEQLMAGATLATWWAIPFAFAVLPSFGIGGATAAYAHAVGWDAVPVGRWVPAHLALAAGTILFSVRTLGHFETLGDPPPTRIDDDPLLQDVIETVEGRRPKRRR